jgi:hypothetical protein
MVLEKNLAHDNLSNVHCHRLVMNSFGHSKTDIFSVVCILVVKSPSCVLKKKLKK